MSLRAIRKIQKEQEEREKANNPTPDHESSDEAPQKPPVRNAFDMLAEANDGETAPGNTSSESDHENIAGGTPDVSLRSTPSKPKKKKKQKRKRKSNVKAGEDEADENEVKKPRLNGGKSQLDEIDLALKSLSMSSKNKLPMSAKPEVEDGDAQLHRLLAVESKHLNALNEMKRLFGNIVLEGEGEGASPRPDRRRGRMPQEVDLAEALTGRHSRASNGQGLSGLALRRNFFMMGKEDWPRAGTGGLGMESDDGTGYRFYHSDAYRKVQAQFVVNVALMDPQRMIELLLLNPYHISTLLQVSEITKQQGDHSISGDLLERVLFSFGRSVNSSFTTALSQGKARLDFRRPENREFWLASWRYIASLGQRGTWQTAYEWAKLLLSLDPENDPYRVVLVLDQLALRAGQWEHFLQLSQCSFFQKRWRQSPNIQISSALARFKAKEAAKSRIALAKCVQQYPWIFTRLLTELKMEPLPRSLWGVTARSEREIFECEMYIICAKDLWENSDAKSFLVEVTKSVTIDTLPPDPKVGQLSIDETRHILLSGNSAMASLATTRFASLSTSASDPLPPSDNNPSYHFEIEANGQFPPHLLQHGELGDDNLPNMPPEGENQEAVPSTIERQNEGLEGFAVLQYFLSNLLPWITPNAQEGTDTDPRSISQRLAEFVQFGTRIPEHLAAHGRHLVEALRNTFRTGTGPPEMQYLTDRLSEALTAREQESREQEGREQEGRDQEGHEQGDRVQEGREQDHRSLDEQDHRGLDEQDHRGLDEHEQENRQQEGHEQEGHEQDSHEQEARAQEGRQQEGSAQGDRAQDDHEREDVEPTNRHRPLPHLPPMLASIFPGYPYGLEVSSGSGEETEEDIEDDLGDNEEDRNQRWLAGQGMLRLRDFAANHGTDISVWSEDPSVEAEGRAIVDEYAERVLKLAQPRTQTFIVTYVLRQGTSVEVRDLVASAIRRIERDRGQDANI